MKPLKDFDWDAFENEDAYTKEERTRLNKVYDESMNQDEQGQPIADLCKISKLK